MPAASSCSPRACEAMGFACTHLRYGEVDNLWAVRGGDGTAVRVRGPHRRGAARTAGGVDASALRAAHRRRHAARPRCGRHEGQPRGDGHGLRTAAGRAGAAGAHRLPAHQRRGRPLDRRHAARGRVAARARRTDPLVRGRRALEHAPRRRRDQGGPARLARRRAHGARRAGPRGLPRARAQPDPRVRWPRSPSSSPRAGTKATRTSPRPRCRSPTSTPARAPPT